VTVLCWCTTATADEAGIRLRAAQRQFAYSENQKSIDLLQDLATGSHSAAFHAEVQLYLGLNYLVLGKTARAREAFDWALTYDPARRLDPVRFKREFIAVFEERRVLPRAVITFTHGCDRCAFRVDGRPFPWPVGKLSLLPGTHRLVLSEAAGKEFSQTVVARGGETIAVELSRGRSVPAIHATAAGSLSASAKPTPAPASKREVSSTPAKAPNDAVGPAPAKRRRRVWTWIALGGALAAGGTAVGLYVSSIKDADEHNASQDPARRETLAGRSYEKALAANIVGFGVGGALLATAVVLFFVEDRAPAVTKADNGTGPRLAPLLGQTTGLRLLHRF
jgi:hypothetical protein